MAISAKDWREQVLKFSEVKAPSGAVYKIKKISAFDLLENDLPIGVIRLTKGAALQEKLDSQGVRRALREVLLLGVVEPKFASKEMADCEPGENLIDDLVAEVDDSMFLFNEILKLTYGDKASAGTFPGEQKKGNSAGPVKSEVPPAAARVDGNRPDKI